MEDKAWIKYLERKKERDEKKKIKEENKLKKKEDRLKKKEDRLKKKEEKKEDKKKIKAENGNDDKLEKNDDKDNVKLEKNSGNSWTRYLERKKVREDKKKIKEQKKKKKAEDKLQKKVEDNFQEKEEKKKDGDRLKNVDAKQIKCGQLELFDSTNIANRESKGKYRHYADALKSEGLLDEIKELLDKRDFIIVSNVDVAKKLGKRFAQRSASTIYWALKYVLFHEGIVCQLRTSIHDTEKTGTLLFMRKRKDEDCLAPSLQYTRNKIRKHRE